MFPIDSDVPVPPARGNLYPFRHMAVGDSFLVPTTPTQPPCVVKTRLRSAIRKAQCRTPGFKGALRVVPGGVRVWRVE